MSELASITDSVVPSGCFAVSTDNIWVMLAIVVISAISSWLQKRNEKNSQSEPWGGEDDEAYRKQQTGGRSPSAPNPNQPLNWEEELKRLMEGKPPLDGSVSTPPPLPPPLPPPIVRRVPPPPPVPARVSRESLPTEDERLPSRESAATPWQDVSLDSLPEPTKPLATLEQSTQAYQRATHLHEAVAARMQRVNEQTEKHGKALHAPSTVHRATNPDARAVVALLRRPASARQALLASFVLAPPKGLES
ncbi:MAG: hypothetical protein RL514_579 [Verrucomicrobiota bacterium]